MTIVKKESPSKPDNVQLQRIFLSDSVSVQLGPLPGHSCKEDGAIGLDPVLGREVTCPLETSSYPSKVGCNSLSSLKYPIRVSNHPCRAQPPVPRPALHVALLTFRSRDHPVLPPPPTTFSLCSSFYLFGGPLSPHSPVLPHTSYLVFLTSHPMCHTSYPCIPCTSYLIRLICHPYFLPLLLYLLPRDRYFLPLTSYLVTLTSLLLPFTSYFFSDLHLRLICSTSYLLPLTSDFLRHRRTLYLLHTFYLTHTSYLSPLTYYLHRLPQLSYLVPLTSYLVPLTFSLISTSNHIPPTS